MYTRDTVLLLTPLVTVNMDEAIVDQLVEITGCSREVGKYTLNPFITNSCVPLHLCSSAVFNLEAHQVHPIYDTKYNITG